MKVDRALSAAFRVAVSVASYNCLQRRSSWAISCLERAGVSIYYTWQMIALGAVCSSINKIFQSYLFLHFCFGTRGGQAHVACAWKQLPLMTSYCAGSKAFFWREICSDFVRASRVNRKNLLCNKMR